MREAGGTRPANGQPAQSLAPLIERARRILLFEQRSGHADTAVNTGLESFVARWSDDLRATGQPEAGELATLIGQRLANYHALDPMRRTAQLRAALALLDGPPAERAAPAHSAPTPSRPATPARPAPARPPRPAPSMRPATPAPAMKEGEWPLARPATPPPDLRPHAMPVHPPRPEDAYLLEAPVTAVAGVGQTQAARLARLGIETVRDLLFNFPREHRDYSQLTKIGQAPFDEVITVVGMIWEVKTTRHGPRTRTTARVTDDSGGVIAIWFNQQYLQKQLTPGSYIVMTGVKQRFGNKVEFNVRSHELPEQGDLINTGRLTPVYPLTEGLNPKAMRKIAKWAVDRCAPFLNDHLPPEVRARAGLLALPEAVAQAHFPDNHDTLAAARKRLAFDEIFLVQLGMLTRRANWQEGPPAPALPAPESLIFTYPDVDAPAVTLAPPQTGLWPLTASCFEPTLPFQFTGAQRRAIREILGGLALTQPMSRLLQGDVGSGKTVVAAAALLAAAANGYQGALLAPTEILAEQHYRGLARLLAPFGLLTVLLTGGQKAKERKEARDALASGQAAVAIGTHALIQEDVDFTRLGLAIVDEQHRFGVEQRDALRRKGRSPHMLVMTATPIPRTLALTLYGDLDVSTLDEMPAGRLPIITRWRSGAQRQEAYKLVESEVAASHQAYIICPLVEESEALEAKSAVAEYERLKTNVFPHLRLGLAHGQLRPAEKDRVMRAFRDGEIDVLVATAVVEVGVDVPNATVMIIEDADRFGLSQSHQFRGRVGRGEAQSYCYLLSQEASATASERLRTLESTTDGFELAEADLRLRGPGDFFGVRQSGLPELKMANMADTRLIYEARTQAEWLWQRDPYLKALEHAALRERVFLFWRNFNAH
ncbi:MAG TPA: ATP-dependent DNA helicase RecG [Ktedonobacterales bacterium]